jgi:hypothetical protein
MLSVAAALRDFDIHTYLLGKKAECLSDRLSNLIFQQCTLNLASGVFEWIDFSLEEDKAEFARICRQGLSQQSDHDRAARRRHPVLRRGAGPWSPRLVAGASGPRPGICQSSPDSWITRPAPDATTGRVDRTLLRASVPHRWDAPHAFAWPPQYPQAVADSCRRLQSRARHAPPVRPRHPAWAAGSPGSNCPRRAFGALARSPTLAGRDFSASHPLIAAVCCFSVTNHHHRLILSRATTYTTGCQGLPLKIARLFATFGDFQEAHGSIPSLQSCLPAGTILDTLTPKHLSAIWEGIRPP